MNLQYYNEQWIKYFLSDCLLIGNMRITKLPTWIAFIWIILSSVFRPVVLILQYTARELSVSSALSPGHHKPRRKHIHRGCRWSYKIYPSTAIPTFWSSNPRPSKKYPRAVDHSIVRSADANTGNNGNTFGLWNIRWLSNKGSIEYGCYQTINWTKQSNNVIS